MEKRLKEAETKRDILKKTLGIISKSDSLFINSKKIIQEKWTIEMLCRLLGVFRSSNYRSIKNPINKREQKHMELNREIKDTYSNTKVRNGSTWLSKDFQASGVTVSRTTVARHMKNMGLMKACVSDITYISCKDGFLYLTCVIDLFDRKLIGWSISDNLTASGTVLPAIRMANRNRPFKERMIFHSDIGI